QYCVPGFYRVGGILFGGNCLQCECNDHAAECDINGECLFLHNTTGPHCDHCMLGFYGDASEGTPDDCQRCSCPLTLESNNFSPTCVLQRPGEFTCDQCQLGYAGAKCERCADGYYGDPAEPGRRCLACECNGNVDPAEAGHCDGRSGECLKCLGHTAGRHCERCAHSFYGDAVTLKNCQACGCHGDGSLSTVCHVITGQCECKAHVIGQTCGRCQVHPLLIRAPNHCFETNDSQKLRTCDCAHTHGNCNADTGECICPPHTLGLKCEECEEGHWGHDDVSGCKVCNCSAEGSSSSQCELQSGQCPCRLHFSGLRCDRCALGYKNFPECTACNCNPDGTREEFCDPALGVCGCEDHGRCSCKENVGGSGCDECKTGTFGLTAQNPSGCSPCFCFGVSSVCEELGGLIRVPVSSDHTHHIDSHYRKPFLLSYGGRLSYTLAFFALDGVGLANHEPQVLMRGGHLRKLVIYTELPAPENGVRTGQELPLTEHKWKYFNSVSDEAVSHADFMSVLSNVEYIIIKASYGSGLQQSRCVVSNISLDTALEADEARQGGDEARLVEACECALGYAGLSCQVSIIIFCDRQISKQTFMCCVTFRNGCQHNTAGEHCHVCAAGYYGKVQGSVRDCSLCTCPLRGQSFSLTCVLESAGDFRCDRCEEGYDGRYCGRCQVCQCSRAGSVHGVCDGRTGSCECKPGVRGHLCDQCEERHVLVSEQCVCDYETFNFSSTEDCRYSD
uniref:Laminin, alpha 5 n=1 Tax=Sinocyclocheilus rhinocerous TaxID=307959 RepID=A0A673JID4_9TELE